MNYSISSNRRAGGLLARLALVVVLVSGCKREEVREYRAPKERAVEPSTALPPGHPGMGSETAGTMPPGHPGMGSEMAGGMPPVAKPSWTLPAGWAEKKPSAMRIASFSVAGNGGQPAEVGIIPLPTTGSELELVNMWRQQLHLPDIGTTDIANQSENIAIGAEQGKLFDIVSAEPLIDGKSKARILVAAVTRGPMSWFFKMTGEDTVVAEGKASFAEFLKSITFGESSIPPMSTAAGVTAAPTAVSENVPSGSGLPEWQAPADWKEQPAGQMVLASFAVGDEASGKATVSISSFPGDVGGLLANVNRWRGQVGLAALADAELEKNITTLEGGAKLVDFTGTDMASGSPKRVVGAIVPQAGKTWFYKLMGNETIIGQQKEAFTKFVQKVKY